MTPGRMKTAYFEWMYHLVFGGRNNSRRSWRRLLGLLHSIEFIYFLDMDVNRAEDGVDLRYRFAYDRGYEYSVVAKELGNRNSSVLEMMVALALRCEEHIMDDPDFGNRLPEWFMTMLVSMGLDEFDDSRFDRYYVRTLVDRMLYRTYHPDGRGGLFTIPGIAVDMRGVEIWNQAMWYFDDYIQRREHA